MRNVLFIICVSIVALFFVKPCDAENTLRLRVIANSDCISDQSKKMRVVEALDRLFDGQDFETLDMAEAWIYDNMAEIDSTCKGVWQGNFTSELRQERYDDGEYRSLVITLGDGRGHNFWGTLFPDISRQMAGAGQSKIKPFSVFSRGGELVEVRFFSFEKFLNIF